MSRYFLTSKGRSILATTILGAALLIVIGVCLVAESNAQLHLIGIILQICATLICLWCASRLQRMPSSADYMRASLKASERERAELKAWEGIVSVKTAPKDLKGGAKLTYIFLYVFGVLFTLYALLDLFGTPFIHQVVIHSRRGDTIVIPRFVTALLELGAAYLAFAMMKLSTFELVDKYDVALKRLFKDFNIK